MKPKLVVVLNPGECQDCEENAPHRVVCPACRLLICPWCWGHVHGLAAVKDKDAFNKVEGQWRVAKKMADATKRSGATKMKPNPIPSSQRQWEDSSTSTLARSKTSKLVISTVPKLEIEVSLRRVKISNPGSPRVLHEVDDWYVSDVFGITQVARPGYPTAQEAQSAALKLARVCALKLAMFFDLTNTPTPPL